MASLRQRVYWAYRRWRVPDQAYFWTEEWQAAERESERELAEGRGRTFDSAEDAIRWLQEEQKRG